MGNKLCHDSMRFLPRRSVESDPRAPDRLPPRHSSDGGSPVEFSLGLCLVSSYDHAKPLWGTSCAMIPCSSFPEVSRLIRGPRIVYAPRHSSDGGSPVELSLGLCLVSSYDHGKPLWGTSCAMIPCSSFSEVSRLIRGPPDRLPPRHSSDGGSLVMKFRPSQ